MTMTTSTAALDTALAYYRAWTGGDFDAAAQYVADDVICHAPAGLLHGADAFRGFMEPFSKILTRAQLLAAFGDEHTAVLVYDTDTAAVHNAPGAEHHTVDDGKITEIWVIFDRLPFEAARRAAN
jgi:ketosteroid isomerase-like protein